jgi:hypothetical protein
VPVAVTRGNRSILHRLAFIPRGTPKMPDEKSSTPPASSARRYQMTPTDSREAPSTGKSGSLLFLFCVLERGRPALFLRTIGRPRSLCRSGRLHVSPLPDNRVRSQIAKHPFRLRSWQGRPLFGLATSARRRIFGRMSGWLVKVTPDKGKGVRRYFVVAAATAGEAETIIKNRRGVGDDHVEILCKIDIPNVMGFTLRRGEVRQIDYNAANAVGTSPKPPENDEAAN